MIADLDHTSLADFRYLLMYIGPAEDGDRLEFLEPVGDGFLNRYLRGHGEGPHHIKITVPDLRDAVRGVRSLGLSVTGRAITTRPGGRHSGCLTPFTAQ